VDDKILEIVDRDVAEVDGTVLSVVQYPFYYEHKRYHAVYLAKTSPWDGRVIDTVKSQAYTIIYKELDAWLSDFVSCKNWSLWPVVAEGVVHVLLREKQFNKLSLYANECLSLRFFADRVDRLHDVRRLLHYCAGGQLTIKDSVKMIEPFILDLASAIHFARTGDLETDYFVLRRHFQVDDAYNLIEVSEEYPENAYIWIEQLALRAEDLAGELKGAIATSSVDWHADLTKLARLGELAMEFRQLA